MAMRRRMKKRRSKRLFRKGAGINKKNLRLSVPRGGYRL